MANAEKLVPFLLKWETGVIRKANEPLGSYFVRARQKGFANDPADAGGATMCGVTLEAFREYCRKRNKAKPGVAELKNITYETWLELFKAEYWNRWQADKITNQAVAEILVDWVWASGRYGITRPQRLLGVTADGIVGQKTLVALNSRPPLPLWAAIRKDRLAFIEQIVKTRPLNAKFKKGWINRINDLKYSES